jgi:pyruvate formate lyase activating enzyme
MAATSTSRIEAKYYRKDGDVYVCGLCPHGCRIPVGGFGRCGARRGDEDFLTAYNYGKVSSLCIDPIEKKPLYHFKPKSRIFSVGGIGCNMACKPCQNYAISISPTGKKRTTFETPEELVSMCRRERMDSIAFTYNEPMIWPEYILDVADVDPDLLCVLVTNGLVREEALEDLCTVTDAMNIDIKGFTDDFYMKVCKAHLDDVLDTVRYVFNKKVHLEITYLVIPGYNDSEDDLVRFSEWIRNELSADVPVHFNRFHPDNEMNSVPWTPLEKMFRAREIALDTGLNYVYAGNVLSEEANDTYCPECGAVVIQRTGYMVDIAALDGNRCGSCRTRLNIIR